MLIELLIGIVVVSIITTAALPAYLSLQNQNAQYLVRDEVVKALYRSQSLAVSGNNDATWGVSIQANQVLIFQGGSYATRILSSDIAIPFNRTIVVSGTSEFVFQKLTGFPVNTGSVYLQLNTNTLNIAINEKGTITY